MKHIFILLLDAILAVLLFSWAANNLSKPSNLYVAIGVFQAILGLVFVFYIVRYIYRKLN
ncbi:hypothetical protein LJ707_08535 [Mucilaginibacter sp. UR6-1]|uniref:hypothetical protein n=1 Tax=Mucilaginibacter sp. UR6-1 TaxID=1435643 RepID=UPI001E6427EA|nr:hypothetical protein [Mucilaginibacter sp. UR6-1]MCC8408975.1 hypothetical protein [Mucilaginibacter sp. UR6-1]